MAVPTGTFQTNSMVGIREDLADAIYNISPVDVPFLSSAPQVTATQVAHEWQTDALAAAANNAAVQGDDAPKLSATPTVRLNNRCQISTKDARVSGTGRAVNTAGRADELAYQLLKRGKELKRDMEVALLANKPKVVGNGSNTADELAGIPAWIKTNVNMSGAGSPANPTGDGTNGRTDGTQRAFTEPFLKEVVRKAWDAGGNPDTIMVGAFNRQVVSGFGPGTKFQKLEDSVLHTSFDVYESDFGMLKIVPNRFQRARDALVLQMDMWAVAFLTGRNMVSFDLAKTGDSDAKQILSEYTLEARNEAANGLVADLTTA
jgi:hypothetical protein